jgi:ubiquinone biosynthesis accessory factor UbiK
MNTSNQFEALFKQFTEQLPKGALELQKDLEKNMRVAMEATFKRMNLVTREEFEIQAAVLAKTRAKLEALEAQLAALEARMQLDNMTTPSSSSSPDHQG